MDTSERDLEVVGELISKPARWSDWVSEDEQRAVLLDRAARSIRLMAEQADWSIEELLAALGCRSREPYEIQEMTPLQLRRCNDYFQWVGELCRLVDRTAERRRIIVGAAHFFRKAGRDLLRARDAMTVGLVSSIEYLELGELDKAFQNAEGALLGRPIEDAGVHLRGKRIDRYLDQEDLTLSAGMRDRISRHLVACRQCSDAVRSRRARRYRLNS